MWPLNLPGPTFALLFLGLGFGLNLLAYIVKSLQRGSAPRPTGLELDPYEIAFLTSRARAYEAAVAALQQNRALVWESGRWVAGPTELDANAHPLEQAVYQDALGRSSYSPGVEGAAVYRQLEAIEGRLLEASLLARTGGGSLIPAGISLCVPLLGVAKILVGLMLVKPVFYLMVMTALSVVPFLAFATGQERLTPLGNSVLRNLRGQNAALRATASSNPQGLSTQDAAMGAALFGVGVLGVSALTTFLTPPRSESSWGVGSSSDSSSSSSSCSSSSSSCSSSSSSCSSSSSSCSSSSCGGGGGCGGCGSS